VKSWERKHRSLEKKHGWGVKRRGGEGKAKNEERTMPTNKKKVKSERRFSRFTKVYSFADKWSSAASGKISNREVGLITIIGRRGG